MQSIDGVFLRAGKQFKCPQVNLLTIRQYCISHNYNRTYNKHRHTILYNIKHNLPQFTVHRCISEFTQSTPNHNHKLNDNVQILHNTEQQTISITPQNVIDQQLHNDQTNNSVRVQPQLAALYTCTVCNTREYKTMSKQAYQHGVVLIRCSGCRNLHLFADHLGWFDNKSVTIESICKQHDISFDTVNHHKQLNETDAEIVAQTEANNTEQQQQQRKDDTIHKLPT